MSTGMMICGECGREVHQAADRTWYHCDTKGPMCEGAERMFPGTPAAVTGEWCGRDVDREHQPEFAAIQRQQQQESREPPAPRANLALAHMAAWQLEQEAREARSRRFHAEREERRARRKAAKAARKRNR